MKQQTEQLAQALIGDNLDIVSEEAEQELAVASPEEG
jgi:hypothetical protein